MKKEFVNTNLYASLHLLILNSSSFLIHFLLLFTFTESEEANIKAEPLEKIREHKSVLKVMAKLEKDLQAVRKKHEKVIDSFCMLNGINFMLASLQ